MSEDTRFHPFEKLPPTQDGGPSGESHPIASGIAGFVCAGLLASVGALFCGTSGVPAIIIVGGSASGPAAGLLLWLICRDSFHYFARGALVLGVVSFVIGGGCLALWGLS